MKDYKLSEIKEICSKYIGFCENCECNKICHTEYFATDWDIEKRNMVELPNIFCVSLLDGSIVYQTIWIHKNSGAIIENFFSSEQKAKKFLEELKEKEYD